MVKLAVGADGAAALVANANPIPVSDAGGALTVDGTVAVSGTVAVTDNAGSLTVDNAALAVTGGGVEATALRVTVASDSTGVLSVDDNGGSLTVDGTVAVSGTVAVTDNAGSLTVDNPALSVVNGGAEATALRVTIANDSTGLVSVDDNGGSLTVDAPVGTPAFVRLSDGAAAISTLPVSLASVPSHAVTNAGTFAVQATLAAETTKVIGTVNIAAAQTIATVTAVTAISNALPAGTNNIGDVDVLTLPALPAGTNNIGDVDVLTVPADPFGANADAASATGSISAKLRFIANTGIPVTGTITVATHAVTNAGTFATQESGAALTALQLIDNLVLVEDVAHVSGDSGLMALAVRRDANTSLVTADGDYAPIQVNAAGSIKVAVTSGGITGVVEDAASAGGEEGVLVMAVRQDTLASSTTTDGDFANLKVNSVGSLYVANASDMVDDAAFTIATSRVVPAGLLADETATDSVDEGDIGVARMTLDRKCVVTPYAHAAAGGHTPYKNLDVDETEDEIKGSGGKLFWIHAMNLAATKRYLKIYNNTAAGVTVGTTAPDLTFALPTMADTNGAGFCIHFGDHGIAMGTGITVAATTGFADNDTGAPGANEVIFNAGYL